MALLTTKDFPGIMSVPDRSGLAQGIFTALQGIQKRKALEEAEKKEQLAAQLEANGALAQYIRDMGAGPNASPEEVRAAYLKQRRALSTALRAKMEKNEDISLFDDAFDQTLPDQFNTSLARVALMTEKGREKLIPKEKYVDITDAQGNVIAQRDVRSGKMQDSPIAPAPAGYKYVKDFPVENGKVVAAYVPEVPGTGEIIKLSEPYEPRSLINQTINTGEKLPANFRWVDPSDPGRGVEPIPGGPADETVKQENLYDEAIVVADKATASLDRYERIFDKYGTTVLPTAAQQELGGAYAAMQLEIKELDKLGVLAGPDMVLIERVLTDPLSVKGKVYEFFGGKEGFKAQMKLVREKIEAARETAKRLYGRQTESSEPAYPPGTVIVNPKTGERLIMQTDGWYTPEGAKWQQ